MVDTLPSTPVPDNDLDVAVEIKLFNADFGDGYSQRAGKGLNNTKRTFPLTWSNITEAEKATLKTFFENHSTGQMFYYTLPDEDTVRKFYLKAYTIKYQAADQYMAKATVEEVYDV